MHWSKKPELINWNSCATREIVLENLEPNDFLFDKDDVDALVIWEYVNNLGEFSRPPAVFDQPKAHLKDD
eukprot:14756259-Ditylum_brightwellii.AAC.1